MSNTLKSKCFITVKDAAQWLKIKKEKVGLVGTAASLTLQDLKLTAKDVGTPGNSITVEYVAGATAGAEVVTVVDKAITVQIADGVSTATQVKAAIDAGQTLVNTTVVGSSVNQQVITGSVQPLIGGAYDANYDADLTDVLVMMINSVCTKVESIIKTTVLSREFTETRDGNNANTIVPQHWPITKIVDLRIDTLRQFPDPTKVDTVNYFLRGQADKRQASTDVEIRLVGQDIVIRDDNEKYILGRIFLGSSLGSIKIVYRAGWAETVEDVPEDIKLATLQLLEYFYYQRDNRDINIASKGVKGESYSKLKDGIPEQIYDLLSPYEDVSFGEHNMPQRNTFKI